MIYFSYNVYDFKISSYEEHNIMNIFINVF
jgi:hypothetical protein